MLCVCCSRKEHTKRDGGMKAHGVGRCEEEHGLSVCLSVAGGRSVYREKAKMMGAMEMVWMGGDVGGGG